GRSPGLAGGWRAGPSWSAPSPEAEASAPGVDPVVPGGDGRSSESAFGTTTGLAGRAFRLGRRRSAGGGAASASGSEGNSGAANSTEATAAPPASGSPPTTPAPASATSAVPLASRSGRAIAKRGI